MTRDISQNKIYKIKDDKLYDLSLLLSNINNLKIVSKNEITFKQTVKNLNKKNTTNINRAGIIPYRYSKEGLIFLMGVDKQYKEITDFGGCYNRKKDKNKVETALREFREETLDIFGEITREQIQDSLAIINNKNLIIFLHMPILEKETIKLFEEKKKNFPGREIETLIWLNLEEFEDLVNEKHIIYNMYSVLVRFFRRTGNFTNLL